MERSSSKAVGFWSIVGGVVVLDIITKIWAVRSLVPERIPREVFGDWVRLTLVRNPGAAFGLYLGPYSRWIFIVLTAVAALIPTLSRSIRSVPRPAVWQAELRAQATPTAEPAVPVPAAAH